MKKNVPPLSFKSCIIDFCNVQQHSGLISLPFHPFIRSGVFHASAEFSFFLGIPVIVGAALLDLLKHHDVLTSSEDWLVLGIGTAVSFIVALLCIRLLVAWVSRRDFKIFAWLRIITGVIVLVAAWGFGYQMAG